MHIPFRRFNFALPSEFLQDSNACSAFYLSWRIGMPQMLRRFGIILKNLPVCSPALQMIATNNGKLPKIARLN
jgi:hypothetical protein